MPVFCMHGYKIFRSLRAHKSRKGEEQPGHAQRIRERKPSEASTVTSLSSESSRPSTSPTDKSAAWDPLRSNPPMHRPVFPSVCSVQQLEQQGFEDGLESGSLHHHASYDRRPTTSSISSGSSTGSYAGFDFDFPNGLAPMPAAHARESIAIPGPDDRESEPVGPKVRSAERDETSMPRPHFAGRDGPDYFMRRGDWKRRGIVFTPEFLLAGEEEPYDHP